MSASSVPAWVNDCDPSKPSSSSSSEASSSSAASSSAPPRKTNGKVHMFFDCSGSVGGSPSYFNSLTELVTDKLDDPRYQFFTWDTSVKSKPASEIKSWISSRRGFGGTSPHVIVPAIDADADEILITTDGQISENDLVRCRDSMRSKLGASQLAKCRLVIIHTSTSGANLSVPAAFAPFAHSFQLLNRPHGSTAPFELVEAVSEDQILLEKYFDDPDGFLAAFPKLETAIRAATLGCSSDSMHKRLCELGRRLAQHFARLEAERLALSSSSSSSEPVDPGQAFLRMTHEERVEHCKQFLNSVDPEQPMIVQAAVSRLIEANKNTALDTSILFGSEARAPIVGASALLPEDTPAELTIEDPVSFEEEGPALLVRAGKAVFEGLELQHREALIRNPLLILNSPDLRGFVRDRISTAMGLSTLSALSSGSTASSGSSGSDRRFQEFQDPLTRSRIVAVLPLSTDPKYRSNLKHALASIFFTGRRLCGNPVSFLAVVWAVVRDAGQEYLAGKPGLMPAFDAFLRHSLTSYSSRLTLSGLPIAPLVDRPMIEGVWYCLHSYWLHGDGTGPKDRLRELYPTAEPLCRMLDVCEVPYDRSMIMHRVHLCRAFAYMMSAEKNERLSTPSVGWRDELRSQYQPHLRFVVGGEHLVFLDWAETSLDHVTPRPLPPAYADLPLNELLGLAELTDSFKKIGDVDLPETPSAEPRRVYNYTGYAPDLRGECHVPIDPTTMRPFKFVQVGDVSLHWSDALRSSMLVPDGGRYASFYHGFHMYVRERLAFPTPAQFLVWFSMQQARRRINTLPALTPLWVQTLFSDYERVKYSSLTVPEFIQRGTEVNIPYQKNRSYWFGAPTRLPESMAASSSSSVEEE